ncbi:hypothetical protein Ancab_035581 [Ancistrocladus abbreviatus]
MCDKRILQSEEESSLISIEIKGRLAADASMFLVAINCSILFDDLTDEYNGLVSMENDNHWFCADSDKNCLANESAWLRECDLRFLFLSFFFGLHECDSRLTVVCPLCSEDFGIVEDFFYFKHSFHKFKLQHSSKFKECYFRTL